MNIEKALRNYLKGNGPKVKNKDFWEFAQKDGNAVINVLFKLANEEIDSMHNKKTLDRVVEVLKLGEIVLQNAEGLNRKLIARKIYKLQEKLDRILSEGKRKFSNINKIKSEFNKVRRELDVLLEANEQKDTKQYDFMDFLIEETKNITYLEYTLKKMPSLANVRDKKDMPLFRNITSRYMSSLEENDEENALYYENLISLLLSQKNFHLTSTERRDCLDDIYKFLNRISYSKKNAKKNKEIIESINQLVEKIKGMDCGPKDIDEIASKYKVHVSFQPQLLEDLKLVKTPMEGEMTGREEVEDYVISIDGEEAVEIDDALSCIKLENGNFRLGVHIASILGYFPYVSEIVREAIYRNQSIYLPRVYQETENDFHRTISIFPYDFAANKGSLLEGEKRLARSYYFEITPTGEVVDEKFIKTIVTNNRRMTYQEVNQILENGTDNPVVQETIENLRTITNILENGHQGNELYERVKENTKDYSELRVKKVGAENIVYQSMLLTGSRVAGFFSTHDYPCLYRVHEVNEENNQKLQAMIETLNQTYGGEQFKNLYQLIEGIYPKGWYASSGRHSGLDVDHYCHCTSPLRRAADIVVEHCLEVCYDKEPTLEEIEQLRADVEEKAVLINNRQSPNDYFVKEYQKKYRRR